MLSNKLPIVFWFDITKKKKKNVYCIHITKLAKALFKYVFRNSYKHILMSKKKKSNLFSK